MLLFQVRIKRCDKNNNINNKKSVIIAAVLLIDCLISCFIYFLILLKCLKIHEGCECNEWHEKKYILNKQL